jgi:hypothetical protein
MTERDAIYVEILRFGLIGLRNSAQSGQIDYCAVESEHLHNIPSLIGETNELRHQFYYEQERTLYLERLDREIWGVAFTLGRYEELWKRLGEINESAKASGEIGR